MTQDNKDIPEQDDKKDILEPGTVVFGYEVLKCVGKGGWSYVYKARHPKLPMFVAIKQLKPKWVENERALHRFLREADTVAQLKHPNVVRIYDRQYEEETGSHHIITEFAEKGTLANRLVESPQGLPVDEVLHIAFGICSGLEAVHGMEVVHRDIKPSNILLCDEGKSRDTPKLSDFGLAGVSAIAGLSGTPSSGVLGSYEYMSPEQLDEEMEVDCRSDLYSVGVLLYQLLTGQVPFTGDTQEELWAKMYVEPTPPRRLRSDIPEALEDIVLRALRKDRKNRYQSAADMYGAVRAIVDTRQRGGTFEAILAEGLTHLENENWEAAIETLRVADILEPGNEWVLEGLQKARDPQGLKRLYDVAVHYLEVGDWVRAQDHMVQVLSYDPDYAGGRAREQVDRAAQEIRHEHRRRTLMVQYHIGLGHFRKWEWGRAIAILKQVVDQNQEFEHAADRLAAAREFARAGDMFERARRCGEQGEWEEAVNLLERVEQVAPPHIDVAKELRHAGTKRDEARQEQRLAALHDAGMLQLKSGKLEQAQTRLQEIYLLQPDYRDVADRLQEVEQEISLKPLFEQASKCEAAYDWEGAIKVYQEILDVDRRNRRAIRRLIRAQNCADRGRSVRIAAKAQNWWDDRDSRARVALMALLTAVILALCIGIALVARLPTGEFSLPLSGPPLAAIRNGGFENKLRYWQRGGQLDQAIACDGDNCYAVLGNPDYDCNGGVPPGEAWMKQTTRVPQTISPTLSLKYRVFSHDLDLDLPECDYFQVAINGEPISQRYGNDEWNEPSCDREAWDSGWQTLSLNLSSYRGEEIELSLRNVNGTQPYYNTWTYVDDVRID